MTHLRRVLSSAPLLAAALTGGCAAESDDLAVDSIIQAQGLNPAFHHDGKWLSPAGLDMTAFDSLYFGGPVFVGGKGDQFAAVRLNADGSRVSGFGENGIASYDMGGAAAASAVVQSPSKSAFVLGGPVFVGNKMMFGLTQIVASNGKRDTQFGDAGTVRTDFYSATLAGISGMATIDDPDASKSRIVAVGYALVNGSYQFALAMYRPDGSLDTSFDRDGKVLTDFYSLENEHALDVLIDSDRERIVVVGYGSRAQGERSIAIAAYHYDGSLDKSFDGDGKVITDIPNSNFATGSALAANADIGGSEMRSYYVAGSAVFGQHKRGVILNYSPDGRLNSHFGKNGVSVVTYGHAAEFHSIIYAPTLSRIYVSGSAGTSNDNTVFALAAYKPDGQYDYSLGVGNGRDTVDFTATEDEGAVDMQIHNHHLFALGFAYDGADSRMAALRYDIGVGEYVQPCNAWHCSTGYECRANTYYPSEDERDNYGTCMPSTTSSGGSSTGSGSTGSSGSGSTGSSGSGSNGSSSSGTTGGSSPAPGKLGDACSVTTMPCGFDLVCGLGRCQDATPAPDSIKCNQYNEACCDGDGDIANEAWCYGDFVCSVGRCKYPF